MSDYPGYGKEAVAIIGMACRFPDAHNLERYWQNLKTGRNSITHYSDKELLEKGVSEKELSRPSYVKSGYIIENIEFFDAEFFGYTARDAELMDPQQRIFLELAWEAIENAGCNPDTYTGTIGIFGGASPNTYDKRISVNQDPSASGMDAFQAMIANEVDFLTTRVSYKLNLKGPSLTLQTACSTSLVAVHVACQNLLTHQCDTALAGGVSIHLPQGVGYIYHDGMLWSPDGYCRAFDAKAQGTVFSCGAGVVVLKRLSEALKERDFIYAVIKGSAVNNDGSIKVGYTAPSVDGQAEAIKKAHAISGTPAETIDYIEAHGTGTRIGDPIEIEALTKAFRTSTDKIGFCGIGSVKTNIGHLDVAAGIASLIKTSLALQYREIPPSLHFEKPNPDIDFEDSPFFVVDRLRAWERNGRPRRAGVSSFGIGGTNAHVVLEEAPEPGAINKTESTQILLLSGKTQAALKESIQNLLNYFKAHPDCSIADAAYTLQIGRKHQQYRKAFVIRDIPQYIEELPQQSVETFLKPVRRGRNQKLVFMFSGQGSQYTNMCLGLYEREPFFRDMVDSCAETLKPHFGGDIREILFPDKDDEHSRAIISETWIAQPALFIVEYCLARLLMDRGITPDAMVGHSIGEYVAACLAGVFSLEDALYLVSARGRLMQDLEPGAMLSVPLSEEQLVALLPAELDLAVVNAPKMSVVAGKIDHVRGFQERLSSEKNLVCNVIYTSHAFHSRMMEPILKKFGQLVASVERKIPEKRFLSNVSGTWITVQQATSSEYWAQHLRNTVRFHKCITTLLENDHHVFLEVGPGKTLITLTTGHELLKEDSLLLPTSRRLIEKEDDYVFFQKTMGHLWEAGINIDWFRIHDVTKTRKIPLPTYPFQRKRFWIDEVHQNIPPNNGSRYEDNRLPNKRTADEAPQATSIQTATNDLELEISNIYCKLLGISRVDAKQNFFDIGGDSLLAVQLLAHLKNISQAELSLADVFEYPSVEGLATRIKEGGGRLRSTVIALNNSPSDHLIYFVVGIQLYQALAQCLEEIASSFGTFLPVEEALFEKGIDADQWTVQELAAAYREEIQRHSHGRPISIIGVSFGGVVGYELARQLVSNGIQVPLLVLLDSLLPSGMHRNYIKWVTAQVAGISRSGFKAFFKKVKTRLSVRQPKRRRQAKLVQFADGAPDQRLAVYADAVDRFEKFSAESTYSGRTLLIQAKDEPRYPGYTIAPHFGWKKHLTGEFHIDSAPGDHLGILKSPNVEATADIVKRVWREYVM